MNIFDERNYKSYLKKILNPVGPGRGQRSQLAHYLSCQTGYISQVLNGDSHFSLEHAYQITLFLKLNDEESEYFMLLVSLGKAGSKNLEQFYIKRINDILKKRQEIKERIKVKSGLSSQDYEIYYSQWYYAAIHILVMIKEFRTREAISQRLGLDSSLVQRCLDFLESTKLVERNKHQYQIGKTRIHLDRDSAQISKHHINWRLQAIKTFERVTKENLHYSSVITLSRKDMGKIKEKILHMLEEVEEILGPSPEEELCSLNVDFFEI